jgi:uncharacterized membrane-anchored protein
VPAIIFHLLYNGALIVFLSTLAASVPVVVGLCLVVALTLLWWLYRKPYVVARELARQRRLADTVRQAQPEASQTLVKATGSYQRDL